MHELLPGYEGLLARPERKPRCAVLLLGGSSGRVHTERARLLARHGAAAAAIRWFGGPGQPPGICEVPLETFIPALDVLASLSPRLAVLGLSKGAEAALLLAALDPRIRVTVALAPSSVVWAGLGVGPDGRPAATRTSFTHRRSPLPFVPYDSNWSPPPGRPPAYRDLYLTSLQTYSDRIPAATIAVERIGGDVVLAAGGEDQVWPSTQFAAAIRDRRSAHGLHTTVVTHPHAGHRLALPGEAPMKGGAALDRGGTPLADAALGRLLWPILLDKLGLTGGDLANADG